MENTKNRLKGGKIEHGRPWNKIPIRLIRKQPIL